MKKIHVPLQDKSYDVLIKHNLLDEIDKYIDTTREIVIISDDNVPKQYITKINSKLNDPINLFFPQGELSKSMETALLLVNKLIEKGVSRNVLIIALGGGVTGDLVGFVASIFMRGVDFIQIPTTLLSQIDSSVGGKVGVNTNSMKNSVGSFKQPILVLIDPNTLQTLDQRQINSGVAELIKYGVIASKSLFYDILNNNIFDNIEEYIYQCIEIKKDIVIQDEYDYGIRQILNYGHTIGHALEQYSNYTLLHGEAVAIGMAMMSSGMSFENDLLKVLNKYNLPTSYEYDKEEIYKYITTDKKASKKKLNIIIVEEMGKGYIQPIDKSRILERL